MALALRPLLVEPAPAEHPTAVEPRAIVAAEPRAAPILSPANADRVAAPPVGPRLLVHHAGGTAADRVLLVADYLMQAGFTVADVRAVPVPITTRTVRYFFQEDRAAAAAVANPSTGSTTGSRRVNRGVWSI